MASFVFWQTLRWLFFLFVLVVWFDWSGSLVGRNGGGVGSWDRGARPVGGVPGSKSD